MYKKQKTVLILCAAICGAFFMPKETAAAEPLLFQKTVYHQHTGDSSGGGCYQEKHTESRTVEVPCGGTLYYWPELDTSQCTECGASYHGDQSGRSCWHTTTKTETSSYYTASCGKSENTPVGNVYLTQSTDEWTKELTLKASYDSVNGMRVSTLPYIWNGEAATDRDSYSVRENGLYRLRLNADANSNTGRAEIAVPIHNIDVTAPSVLKTVKEPEEEWTDSSVLVRLEDVRDLQPDGSEGCGLHEKPYSYDGGNSWTEETSFQYKENGRHTVYVRDRLENAGTFDVEVNRIDCTGPEICRTEYDETDNIAETVLQIEAKDLQPDGSEGCGLHEKPYSFDGGETWTDESSSVVTRNGTLHIAVRDRLENRTEKEVEITNIDSRGPEVSFRMVEESWTNQDVKIYLSAKDCGMDGTEGAGLPADWYSLDGGETWSGEPVLNVGENTELRLTARDLNDNRTVLTVSVVQIDRILPWVNLEMRNTDAGVELAATAGDEESGLADEAYSWDNGCSFGRNATLPVTENGVYRITVRDRAGNRNCSQITVDSLKAGNENSPKPDSTGKIPAVTEKETVRKEKPVMEKNRTPQETDTGSRDEKKEPEKEPEKEHLEIIPDRDVPKAPFPLQDVLIGTGILLCSVLLVLLPLLTGYRKVRFYERDGEGYRFICNLRLKDCEDIFAVEITEKVMARCLTTDFQFKLPGLFVKNHRGECMNLFFPGDRVRICRVEKEIAVQLF